MENLNVSCETIELMFDEDFHLKEARVDLPMAKRRSFYNSGKWVYLWKVKSKRVYGAGSCS